MSALTKDRNTVRKQGEYAAYLVKGGGKVYAGSIVSMGPDGYAVPGSDTAGQRFLGISGEYVDNSAGADGDLTVTVWRRGCFELSASGMTMANIGDAVYIVDDQTVGLAAATANDVPCGRISEFNSAASVYVDIEKA